MITMFRMSQLDFFSICNFIPVYTKHSDILESSHEILSKIIETPHVNTIDGIISCFEQIRTSFENHTGTFSDTLVGSKQRCSIQWIIEIAMMCIMWSEYGGNVLVVDDRFEICQYNIKMLHEPVRVPLTLMTHVRRFQSIHDSM
ncbi:hypothetical protein NY2A_b162L [Paramecium bursaria Chlorella virus NY2A]|uniref:Uncharacterized protein b162L n=1 Tax=Paramecium bursaria Chlorella virus NY2A TaxID=46021 RepID=A7IW37_PBCVN|nr:hypothetical protein NY2A_b162L [Paramecium bursaria Chlorella virus NY2A]ABT14561.1 hypothetical protein NY2A_b162L [Paramecium bursaria Chlorella virus NY2A]